MKISIETTINTSIDSLWEFWTKDDLLRQWFSPEANIDPQVGGSFELFFDPANHSHMSTQGCVFTKVEKKKILEFTWKGPDQFAEFMNNRSSLTTVKVKFSEDEQKIKLKLEHIGWRFSSDWNNARNWHEKQWNIVLRELKKKLESEKTG
ncbi:MAG: SRPBCC family protein [Candidatus Hodarchaeales archaeon]|jgi:uncharacterized protein YndB with AHSA1/START domain